MQRTTPRKPYKPFHTGITTGTQTKHDLHFQYEKLQSGLVINVRPTSQITVNKIIFTEAGKSVLTTQVKETRLECCNPHLRRGGTCFSYLDILTTAISSFNLTKIKTTLLLGSASNNISSNSVRIFLSFKKKNK
jgi:hypothetical protein